MEVSMGDFCTNDNNPICLLLGLLFSPWGCSYQNTQSSTTIHNTDEGLVVDLGLRGTCKDDSYVKNEVYNILSGICGGNGYKIISPKESDIKCKSGFYDFDLKAQCE